MKKANEWQRQTALGVQAGKRARKREKFYTIKSRFETHATFKTKLLKAKDKKTRQANVRHTP